MILWLGVLLSFRATRAFESTQKGVLKAMTSTGALSSSPNVASDALMENYLIKTTAKEGERGTRYLWTDAFAVCNLLGFYRSTNNKKHLNDAISLVDQVHAVLGQHRPDDAQGRTGWISGLDASAGRKPPTRGGLRIGKPRNERQVSQAPDERLEWEQDGQYFHYLTKWMHALDAMSRVTGNKMYNDWAIELAQSVHAHFVYEPGGGAIHTTKGPSKRMFWKMSIDLR
jgi:uncharacterized protein YyaL (SSP411 family)